MAHKLFTDANGKTSFAAVGQTAWHGLGQYVTEAMTAAQAIDLGGLDYVVEKQEIKTAGGIIIPNAKATVRVDTQAPLGIVTDAYEVIQNKEMFEFFDAIIDRGEAIYQTVGAIGQGEKIFITAKLPTDILVHGEQVENYLLLTGGHDGRSPIQAGFTSIRVVCNNTLTAALRELQNKVTVMHYSNAKSNLREASRVMGMATKYQSVLNEKYQRMADVKITDAALRSYIETVMNPKKEVVTSEEFSKQFVKQVDSIFDFAKTHYTQTTDAAEGTLWGAYNAISGYYGWIKEYETPEAKMKDLYYKGAAKKLELAFSVADSLLS